jgi:hypothetical protein
MVVLVVKESAPIESISFYGVVTYTCMILKEQVTNTWKMRWGNYWYGGSNTTMRKSTSLNEVGEMKHTPNIGVGNG